MNRKSLAVPALLVLTLLPAAAFAQKKVPGEMYRNTTSMEMMGMSMPGRTAEMCVPVGKAAETLGRPNDPNCRVYDTHSSGNKFTGKMSCTGTNAMEGDMEIVTEGKTVKGVTHMKMKEGEGTMKFESTRLGTPCEAVDYSDYKPPVVAVPKMDAEAACKQQIAEIEKDPSTIGNRASLFVGQGASCAKSATQKTFCSLAQTHRGFMSLDLQEKRYAQVLKSSGGGGNNPDATFTPLSSTISGCGLGKMPGAAESLRGRLVGSADAQGEYEFLIAEGGDAGFAAAVAAAKRECSGRKYTNAANPKFRGLCGRYGLMLVRGDRAGILSIIDGSCSGDCGSGDSGAAAAGASGSAVGAVGTNGQGPPQQVPQQDAANETTKDKAKDTVDKGKKLLRGLLGGG
jgi:hypothetical protein